MSTKLPGLRAQMSLSAVAASAPQQFRLFDRHALPAVPARAQTSADLGTQRQLSLLNHRHVSDDQ